MKRLVIIILFGVSIALAQGSKATRSLAQVMRAPRCGDYFCKETFEKDDPSRFIASALTVYDSKGRLFCSFRAPIPERYKDAVGLDFPTDPSRYILTTWQDPGNPGGWTYRILDLTKTSASRGACIFWADDTHKKGEFSGENPTGVMLPQKPDLEDKIPGANELILPFSDVTNPGKSTLQTPSIYTCSINTDKILVCKDSISGPQDNPPAPENQ